MNKRAGIVVVSLIAMTFLLPTSYMAAFYIARPNDPNQRERWEHDIGTAVAAGKTPFFYPACEIDWQMQKLYWRIKQRQ